ncbi:MAG TPA: sigma-70 family RNA polymerase sigma factor [Bryobacteraceae bacterium]
MPSHLEQPEDAQPPQITQLLKQMQLGNRDAGEQAVALVYNELHRIAANHLRKEAPGHTLVATALIHEAYVRLAGGAAFEIQNRGHFFAIASQQMRRILVDHARGKNALRRGSGAIQVGLDQVHTGSDPPAIDLLLLDESLRELERVEPRAAKVVELRYFGGYTDKEVVEALGVSLATVRRDWEFARCWLFDRMQNQLPSKGT